MSKKMPMSSCAPGLSCVANALAKRTKLVSKSGSGGKANAKPALFTKKGAK